MFQRTATRLLALGAALSLCAASAAANPLSTLHPHPAATPSPGGEDDDKSRFDVDWESLGMSVIERAGLSGKPLEEISPEDLLETSFLTMRLGIFDLGISKYSAKDREKAGHFIELAGALLKTQSAFLDWFDPKTPGLKETRKDIKTLHSWLKGLRPGAIVGLDEKALGEMSTFLKPDAKVTAAQTRFGAFMAKGTILGLEREGELVEPVLIAPTRREFLEMLGSFGLIYPDQQYIYHDNEVLDWTNTYCNDLLVVALEFADLGSSTSGAFGGISMNSRTGTGMEQQIAQLAAGAMFDNLYGSKIPPSLAGAFAVNLVIDIYSECNTRVDGDLNSRRTEAHERFVPGGNSEGGILPPNMADSRWRTEQGADHYLTALQGSQAAGAGEAKKRSEKNLIFQVKNDGDNKSLFLRAPFLGTLAAERNLIIPDDFFGDSQEMFRAYRTAFAHWLETKALRRGGDKAFAELLTALAQREPTDDALETAIQEIYGKPLTSGEPKDKDSLEGEFLIWLSKI